MMKDAWEKLKNAYLNWKIVLDQEDEEDEGGNLKVERVKAGQALSGAVAGRRVLRGGGEGGGGG